MPAQPDKLPGQEDIDLARASASELSRLLRERPAADRARVRLDDHELILPRGALLLLRGVLSEMAQGNAVSIVPTHAELTTQEAANFLNVSRPHVVKLLDAGELRHHKVGTHRRIRYLDLIEYKERRLAQSEAALDALAEQAQQENMGY